MEPLQTVTLVYVQLYRKLEIPLSLEGFAPGLRLGEEEKCISPLFNLNQGKTIVLAELSHLAKVLHGVELGPSCKCTEIWSKQECPIRGGSVSMGVESHGAALLVLNCRPQ